MIDGDTGAPLNGAIVQLGGVLSAYANALTDAKGRFVFTDLPPGRYTIAGRKLGYFDGVFGEPLLRLRLVEASYRPRPLVLGEAEWFPDATIILWRPGAIDGVVRDERGEPLVGKYVRLIAAQRDRHFESLAFAAVGRTDDRGVFSIGRLPPGQYFVGVLGINSDPTLEPTTAALVYPTTYFPSTPLLKEAQPVMVASGRTTSGVEITVFARPGRVVAGRVDGPGEARANLRLVLTNADDVYVGTTSQVARTVVRPDGSFSFPPVVAGRYVLTTVSAAHPEEYPPPATAAIGGPRDWFLPRWGAGEPSMYMARTDLEVGDRDVTDLIVPLTRGVTVSGTIRSDRADDQTLRSPLDIHAKPAEPSPGLSPRASELLVNLMTGGGKGSFEINRLAPGKYFLVPDGGSPMVEMRAGGRDINGRVLDLSSGSDVTDVEIVLTASPKVKGKVRIPPASETSSAIVVYFPVDPALWTPGSGSSRMDLVEVRTDGTYETRDFPPGRYFLAAVSREWLDRWRTPEFLAAAGKVAATVDLARGEVKSLDLDVVEVRLKKMRRQAALIGIATALAAAAGHAWRQEPSQSAGAAAVIEGRVVSADESHRPIRMATVEISGAGLVQRTLTNDLGEFRLSGLSPGQYRVTASKAAYVRSEYGAKEVGGPGTPVVVAPDAPARLTIPLPRGGVLTGVIRQNGEPTPDVVVAAHASLVPVHEVWTNHDGEYRIYGLPPGEYVIEAKPRLPLGNLGSPAMVLQAGAVDSVLAQLRARGSQGRGTATTSRTISDAARSAGVNGYAPVYFPGTIDRRQAITVPLAAGEERAGLDFEMVLRGTARLRGHVVGPSGSVPARASVTAASGGSFYTASANGGTFEFSNIPPGQYTLEARVIEGWRDADPSANVSLSWWAAMDIDVAESIVEGITLTLQPPMTLSGRVVVDGAQRRPEGARVSLRRSELHRLPLTDVSTLADVNGEFRLTGIGPGTYALVVSAGSVAGEPLWLRSAVVNGRDLLDAPLQLGGATKSLSNLVVTLTSRHTVISGTLRGVTGDSASDHHVLLFSTQPDHWYPTSRRVVSVRPAVDGSFMFRDVPPGDYYIAALTTKPVDWQSFQFLSSVTGASLRVALHEGEHVIQQLQLSR